MRRWRGAPKARELSTFRAETEAAAINILHPNAVARTLPFWIALVAQVQSTQSAPREVDLPLGLDSRAVFWFRTSLIAPLWMGTIKRRSESKFQTVIYRSK